ncbi:hypothetical protein Ddye_005818 [Dipteronia dyeriana]|uniref:RNase H type-1 domain-containing protein n=1 Tax=Dipteronia dyeriana TaxID=168575 RepID=A0AAD9XH66_9ROSI|nr:hypothetical protein Ddye_005818 [Dipteronia dyeriana]
MLVKQCWWLLTKPNSLVARVIKGRYFLTSTSLQADFGGSWSFVWRSFLWGLDFLVTGLRWKIGARSYISIYHYPWIPGPFSLKIQSSLVLGSNALGRSLFTTSDSRNEQLICTSFLGDEADAIMSLPLESSQAKDSLLWHFEKSGAYTATLLLGNSLQNACSNSDVKWNGPVVEEVAILRGLRFMDEFGCLHAILESDSKGVVDLINSDNSSFAKVGVVTSDIVALSS